MQGKTLEQAASKAAMSERSARSWQDGALPSQTKTPRAWRTRTDPLAGIWDRDVVPLLADDQDRVLEAPTVLRALRALHPDRFPTDEHLRTLQRRIRDWRAASGPPRVVIFPQEHPLGREASIDFTVCNALAITIAGVVFPHLLFEFVLSASAWTWVGLAFRETFESLVEGLQGALWALGGVPQVIRSDNLSAATHELPGKGRALTRRFRTVLDHYGLTSTRIKPGESHENGVVEQRHRRTKSALLQALVLRGSRDFPSIDAYMTFVRQVVHDAHNALVAARFAEERPHLRALPAVALPNYTVVHAVVRCWSTIRVGQGLYSVPSRLIGHTVEARLGADTVEVYVRQKLTATMPRVLKDGHFIDYRHIIWSLVRKPGAFARYKFREELFPSLVFRRAYDALVRWHGHRADVEYVRILHLAASTFEATVERALASLLVSDERFDYAAVKAIANPETPQVPVLHVPEPDLRIYDQLLGGAR
jgi:hypothetical protein